MNEQRVKCDYCQQWAQAQSACEHCGAPTPAPDASPWRVTSPLLSIISAELLQDSGMRVSCATSDVTYDGRTQCNSSDDSAWG